MYSQIPPKSLVRKKERERHALELKKIDAFYDFCVNNHKDGKWIIHGKEYALHGISVANLVMSFKPVNPDDRDYFFDAERAQKNPA